MSKKKSSVPLNILNDLKNTLGTVKNHVGTLSYKVIPIDTIEFDPENPREMSLSREDILNGLIPNDPLFEPKSKELESLQQLSETIKKYGVRNAVEVYKHGENYRLIHGERRCLASLLAGKIEVSAKILDDKPSDFDIRLLQFIENAQREDLTLSEFISNVRSVIDEYRNHVTSEVIVDINFLAQLINKSRTQCSAVMAVLNAPEDVQIQINAAKIRNLDKAALLSKIKDDFHRKLLLKASLEGASLSEMKKIQKNIIEKDPFLAVKPILQVGKKAARVNMGTTTNKKVVEKLVKLVTHDKDYAPLSQGLNNCSFNDYESCNRAFKQLIQIMEKIER